MRTSSNLLLTRFVVFPKVGQTHGAIGSNIVDLMQT